MFNILASFGHFDAGRNMQIAIFIYVNRISTRNIQKIETFILKYNISVFLAIRLFFCDDDAGVFSSNYL